LLGHVKAGNGHASKAKVTRQIVGALETDLKPKKRVFPKRRTVITAASQRIFDVKVTETILRGKNGKLRDIWEKLDDVARHKVVMHLSVFIGSLSDSGPIVERRKRGMLICKALSKQISALRTACDKRRQFEVEQVHGFGAVANIGSPYWCGTRGQLSFVLANEILRLETALLSARRLFNDKRLGIGRPIYRLIFVQEFVRGWSGANLSETLRLTPRDLAKLIDVLNYVSGREADEDYVDPENLRKTIDHFRKNELNKVFLEQVEKDPLRFCS
jgi:hypothetical protein